jgi:hypothetical protein
MGCYGCNDCMFENTNISADMHEIHITVDAIHTDKFVTFCNDNDIKPIVISYGDQYLDPMTSHKFKGSIDGAKTEIARISGLLQQTQIPPIRVKVETTLINPIVKDNNGYFESHLGIILANTDEARLRQVVADIPALHLSRNALKSDAMIKTIMATYRGRDMSPETFVTDVTQYRTLLEQKDFTVDKQIIEYCWLDTNEDHDNAWFLTK